jgi:hypothetical protein
MTHKISSDGAAVVAPEFHWLPIDEHTPRGKSVLLINKASGVLQKGQHSPGETFFTHWAPNPTFKKDSK